MPFKEKTPRCLEAMDTKVSSKQLRLVHPKGILCDLHKDLIDFNVKHNYFKRTPYTPYSRLTLSLINILR